MERLRRLPLSILLIAAFALLGGAALQAEAPGADIASAEAPAAAKTQLPDSEVELDTSAVSCDAEAPAVLPLENPLMVPEPTPTTCSATAFCSSGTVSCTGCPANRQHASCPNQRGWVSCGGQTTYCPPCPPAPCNPSCKVVCGLTGGQCSNGTCYCY